MKRSKLSQLLLLLLMFPGGSLVLAHPNGASKPSDLPISQQTVLKVKGTVVDAAGEPLIGVNIRERGTSNGTITDINGSFSLSVAEGAVIEVSYIGYKTLELEPQPDLGQIVMTEDTEVLDEVVVTALGIKRAEKALSYNVQEVKSDELIRAKDANFVNSLNGKIAGVTINRSASGVGGATRVVMRGAKSIEGDNNVLYVVDGIPLFNTNLGQGNEVLGDTRAATEGIADFNPEDIESISVLSGPSAAEKKESYRFHSLLPRSSARLI